MSRRAIQTDRAPAAIGTYSQAIAASGSTVFVSGQIALDPKTGQVVSGGIDEQVERVLQNLTAVAKAAHGSLGDIVKLNVYLRDLSHFPNVNAAMERHFEAPFPARAVIGVAALPLDVLVEIDAILVLEGDYTF